MCLFVFHYTVERMNDWIGVAVHTSVGKIYEREMPHYYAPTPRSRASPCRHRTSPPPSLEQLREWLNAETALAPIALEVMVLWFQYCSNSF